MKGRNKRRIDKVFTIIYNILQIRLTNGKTLTQSFGSKEQLSAVRLFVEMNRTDDCGPFNLMTNFPKKVFTEEDYDVPLDVLGMPCLTLI